MAAPKPQPQKVIQRPKATSSTSVPAQRSPAPAMRPAAAGRRPSTRRPM